MKRGEFVLLDWPYSDQTGSKLRPAIVVQADDLNGLLDEVSTVRARLGELERGQEPGAADEGSATTADPARRRAARAQP